VRQLETAVAVAQRPGTDRTGSAMDAAFGRKVLDIVCAAYASAGRGGAPEAVPFTGPRDRTPLQLWRGA